MVVGLKYILVYLTLLCCSKNILIDVAQEKHYFNLVKSDHIWTILLWLNVFLPMCVISWTFFPSHKAMTLPKKKPSVAMIALEQHLL